MLIAMSINITAATVTVSFRSFPPSRLLIPPLPPLPHLLQQVLAAETTLLRKQLAEVKGQVADMQSAKFSEVEEVVYLRWVNACLRYELRNFKAQGGQVAAKELQAVRNPQSQVRGWGAGGLGGGSAMGDGGKKLTGGGDVWGDAGSGEADDGDALSANRTVAQWGGDSWHGGWGASWRGQSAPEGEQGYGGYGVCAVGLQRLLRV